MTASNATLVAALGNAFLESYVQLTISSLDNLFDLSDSGQLTTTMSCASAGGSGTITLVDNDANGRINGGDRVELDYSGCLQASLGDLVTGRINIDVISLTIGNDLSTIGDVVLQIPASLTFASGAGDVEVSGTFRASFVATSPIENLEITASGTQGLSIVLNDGARDITERSGQVFVSRRIAGNAYAISASFGVESDTIGGTFSCATAADLFGELSVFPTGGALACTGRNNSRVRVVASGPDSIATEVDPEGDGSFIDGGVIDGGNGLWGDYVEGQLFSTRVDTPTRLPPGSTPDATSVELVIDVVDAAYNSVDGRVYVTNDSGLAVVDTATMTQVDFVAISGRPGVLDVSDDGSTVWIGLRDTSEIVPIDVDSLAEGARIALGNGVAIALPRFASDLAIAPGTTDTIVIASENTREVFAFSAGAELPNIVDELGAPTVIEFRDASTIIGVNDTSTIFAATLLALDGNGLSALKNHRAYSTGFNITMALDGSTAWLSAGRAIDMERDLVLGSADFQQFEGPAFPDGVYLDPVAEDVWFYNDLGDKLLRFERATFRALGEYSLPTNGDMIRMLGTAGSDVLLVLDTALHRVDLSPLGPTAVGRDCSTLDLGGQLGTAVYLLIDCLFNDAVYDSARDLIYASVPSAVGQNGNTVAIISPQTGAVQSYVYIGSEPDQLSISGGGTRLYVTLQESNSVGVLDLASQTLADTIRLENDAGFGGPGFAAAVAASTQSEIDMAVVTENTLAIYSNGTRLADFDQTASGMANVFYDAAALRVYGIDDNNRLSAYDVQPGGLTFDTQSGQLLQFLGVKLKDDLLYDRLGAIVDAASASVIANCPTSATSAVEPDPTSDDVFYLQTGFDSVFDVCDRNSLSITTSFTIPRFDTGFFQPSLTKAGSNRIAIRNSDKILLLDPNEF
jgi:YVTN family beta-propeller protein